MARSFLLAMGLAWAIAGVGGLVVAALGTERIEAMLPPLAISTDALRGTIVAVSAGVLVVGIGHIGVLLGLRTERPIARTIGILAAALMGVVLLALAVTSATTAAVDTERAWAFVAGAVALAVGAVAYGAVAAQLIGERRAR